MEYTLTKKDVAKLLERTPKSVSRYVKLKQLHPTLVKRGRYEMYMFNLEEVNRLKVELQGGTFTGEEGKQEGTRGDTPTPDKQGSVNNLHGVQEGTQGGKQEGTKLDTSIGDEKLVKTLNRVIDILEKQVDNTKGELETINKVVENQSKQIENMLGTQQFLLNENTAFRKQLGLPTVRDDMNNGGYSEVIEVVKEQDVKQDKQVNKQEGKVGGTQDRKQGGTNNLPKQPNQPPKKSKNKGKKNKSGKGNKDGNKGVQEQVKQPTNNPITSGKTAQPQESKQENRERFNLFKWIFK